MDRIKQLLQIAITFEMCKLAIGEQYTINWTETSAVGLGIESHYQDPAVISLAPCPCDLTSNHCNLQCCCDQDCKPHDRAAFQCFEGLEGGQQTPQDFDYNCNYPGPYSPEWHSFLCYMKNNNPYLGLFFKNDKIIQEYQKYLTRVHKPKYSYESTIFEADDISFSLNYKANRSVEVLLEYDQELIRSPLVLPQPVLNGHCIHSIPVIYLEDFKHQCSVTLSQHICENDPILSYDSYLMSNNASSSGVIPSVISNLGTLETLNATVNYLCLKNALKFIKINGLSKTAMKYMRDHWDVFDEYFEECYINSKPVYNNRSKMCDNVVLSVEYKFGWKGPNITEAIVEIILGSVPVSSDGLYQNFFRDLDERVIIDKSLLNIKENTAFLKKQYIGLLQNFEVQFFYSNLTAITNLTSNNDTMDIMSNDTNIDEEFENFDSLTERSGNPGYAKGKPVLGGYIIYNITEVENQTQEVFSHVDISDSTGLLTWLPDATSRCENVAADLVLFGIDSYSSCIYTFSGSNSCKDVRQEIASIMAQLVLADVVSKMGSPNVTNEDLFLPIITNTDDHNVTNSTHCFIPTALQHEIIYRNIVDQENSVGIYQIIGIFSRYQYTEIFIDSKSNNTELLLSSSVVHFHSPKPSQLSRFWELMEDRWCAGGTCWRELLYPWTHGADVTHGLYNEYIINIMKNSAFMVLLSLPILYFLIEKNIWVRL